MLSNDELFKRYATDPSHIDPNGSYTDDQLVEYILSKIYAKDVRGTLGLTVKRILAIARESDSKATDAYEVMTAILDESFDSAKLDADFTQRLDEAIQNLQPEWTAFSQSVNDKLNSKAENKFYKNDTFIRTNLMIGEYAFVEEGQGSISAGSGYSPGTSTVIGGNTASVGDNNKSNRKVEGSPSENTALAGIFGGYDIAVTGLSNRVYGADHSFIKDPANHAAIMGGTYNKIEHGSYVSIGGGFENTITSSTKTSINSTTAAVISGGRLNKIDDGMWGNIAGGSGNNITTGTGSVIGGGVSNSIVGTNNEDASSTIAGGAANSITGAAYGSIAGGSNNLINFDFASILGGTNNVAGSPYTTILGSNGLAHVKGSIVESSDETFGKRGSAQRVRVTKTKITTNGNATNVSIPLQAGNLVMFRVRVTGQRTDSVADVAGFIIEGLVRVSATNVGQFVGTPTVTTVAKSGAADYTVSPVMGGQFLVIQVKGVAGQTVQWHVEYDLTENVA